MPSNAPPQRNAERNERVAQTHVLVGLTTAVAGRSFRIHENAGDIVIGRSSTSTFQIAHPAVSRRHAQISYNAFATALMVTDLNSAHGTWVNEKRVIGSTRLGNGDTLRLGKSVLLKCVAADADADVQLENFAELLEEAETQTGFRIGPPSGQIRREPSSSSISPASVKTKAFGLICVRCGVRSPGRFDTLCPCGGMLDAAYDFSSVRFADTDEPFQRFADLLPVRDPSVYPSTEYTPCIHAEALGKAIGLPWVYLKNETAHPTGSTKDRSAVIVLAMLRESGIQSFATSSTGNAGTAYCYALQHAAFASMQMNLFVGERYVRRSHYGDIDRVQVYALRDGTFEEACAVAAAYAKKYKMLSDGGFFSPGKREGAKLAFFEATDQVPRPIDWYVQAISSGLGVEGTFKGATELLALRHIDRLPRLLCVQEDTCSPQVQAWREGAEAISPHHIVHRPEGLALAIHRGDPSRAYPYLRKRVVQSRGTYTAVSASEILEACAMVRELEGIEICHNSGAAVAGIIREARAGTLSPNETVLVNLTGRDRKPETTTQRVTWLEYNSGFWASSDGTISIDEQTTLRRAYDRMRSGYPPAQQT